MLTTKPSDSEAEQAIPGARSGGGPSPVGRGGMGPSSVGSETPLRIWRLMEGQRFSREEEVKPGMEPSGVDSDI